MLHTHKPKVAFRPLLKMVKFISYQITFKKSATSQELVVLVKHEHEIAENIMDMAVDSDAEYQSIFKHGIKQLQSA